MQRILAINYKDFAITVTWKSYPNCCTFRYEIPALKITGKADSKESAVLEAETKIDLYLN